MDVSQLYMLALRPTMVPILGESTNENGIAGLPSFYGQVELDGWSWDFHSLEEMKRLKNDPGRERYEKRRKELDEDRDAKFQAKLEKLEKGWKDTDKASAIARKTSEYESLSRRSPGQLSEDDEKKRLKVARELSELYKQQGEAAEELLDDAQQTLKDQREAEKKRVENDTDAEREYADKNFQFKFSKRVDAATTQLLNCMKAGDLLPTVTLSMYQASSNTPWSLVITVTKVRLLKYTLRIEATDTMTDMREDWEAEFASFGYVYQNRPHAGVKAMTAGHANTAVARGMTQSTVRTFMMKKMDFF